ncbi:MAG TPA: OmpH family outer membrane protein [Steroidobacteraceae bacterium]|nr:OmpH family outer membrane protein [Steroidobacteraceae bacterium]
MKRRSSGVLVAGVLALFAVSAPAWADLKIGFVNYARLMQESPQAKVVQQTLRNEFAGKQKELSTEQQSLKDREAQLQRDGATMSADQRTAAEQVLRDGNRELSEKVNEYQDDFNARQNQELSKLQKVLVEQVQRYAQAQRFDLVLADGVIWANPSIDITQPVLAALQASGASSTSGAARSGTSKSRK